MRAVASLGKARHSVIGAFVDGRKVHFVLSAASLTVAKTADLREVAASAAEKAAEARDCAGCAELKVR